MRTAVLGVRSRGLPIPGSRVTPSTAQASDTGTMVGVFLLLKAKDGRKRPTKTKIPVRKGELVEELKEAIPADRYSGEHNYRIYNYEPTITLYCHATDVLLVDPEHLYLMAVSYDQRLREFLNDAKKQYVFGLKTGDGILFAMSAYSKGVRGRIRYIGVIKGKKGVYFGVEIDKVNY